MKIKGGIERSGPSILGPIGEAALSTPLPSPRCWTSKHITGKIKEGSFYEINHSKLPSTAPHMLRSLRVVLVTAKTEMNVTVRYPSIKSLESYLEIEDNGALRFRLYPSLNEKYVMGPIVAVEVLGRVISSEEFGEHRLAKSFWLIDCFSSEKLPSPVSVCDVSIPPEVKKGPLFLDLQSQLKGWGSQRLVAYLPDSHLPDSPEEMDVRSHSEEMSTCAYSEEMNVVAYPEEVSVYVCPEAESVPAHLEAMSVPAQHEANSVPAHPKAKIMPAHHETKNVPAHPDAECVPAQHQGKSVPAHPEAKNVLAHPEGKNVPAHHQAKSVPAQPKAKSVPAHPEGKNVPAHPEGKNVPAHPEAKNVLGNLEAKTVPGNLESKTVPGNLESKTVPAHPESKTVSAHPESKTMPAHPESKTIPAQHESKTIPAHPESKTVPAHLESKTVRAHPESMTVLAHPESKTVPAHPEAKTVPAHPEAKTVPAHPEAKTLPSCPEAKTLPSHPEAKSVPAHPESKSAPAQPEAKSAPAQPEAKSAPAQPEAKSAPAHPKGITVPAQHEGMSEHAHPEEMTVCAPQEEGKRTVKKEEETMTIEDRVIIPYTRKRKRASLVAEDTTKKIKHTPKSEPVECKAIVVKSSKNQGYVQRWLTKRYEAAAMQLCEVLEANRAVYGNPIPRTKLRSEARTRIGDTGLLDHLLKHLCGKVIPGGDKRLRRRCDADGKMEYWLESADLAQIRKDAGVQDPYWTPPPGWKLGDCVGSQSCLCGEERKKHKEEISSLKRQIEALKSVNVVERAIALVRQDSSVSFERRNSGTLMLTGSKSVKYEELLKKRSLMEKQLVEISQALMGVEEDMKMLSYPYHEEPENRNSPDKERRSETAEAASDDAEGNNTEEERGDSRLRVRLRVKKLKPCEHQDNFSGGSPSRAVSDVGEEDHLVLTPPGSTTTSLTTH